MRALRLSTAFCSALLVGVAPFLPVHAQAPAADATPRVVEQKAERITHEDAGSRVDELRVGGVTRKIDVQPKSGTPAYDVQPSTATQGTVTPAGERSGSQGSAGRSSWRVLSF